MSTTNRATERFQEPSAGRNQTHVSLVIFVGVNLLRHEQQLQNGLTTCSAQRVLTSRQVEILPLPHAQYAASVV